jgi:adenine-specific DNA-methyltransferase
MSAFQKLRSKLSELFQLDAAAELDFGIYRILNARRVEISEFLDSLEGQVDRILAEAMDSGAGEARAELAKAEADLRAMGLNDDAVAAVPKIRELRGKIATGTSDPTALSHEIFSHLATFFSRYYQDGDFISLRRYKKDTYAIPYEGEEVKLHWANADQYYIKSSETLRDYSFRLGPAPKGDKPDTRPTVTFKLVEADIEKDNAKAVAGQERRFVFQGVVDSDARDHLVLGFAYLPLGKAEKQSALNESTAKAILTEHAKGAFTELAAKDHTYTGSQKGGRTIFAKHLTEYTGRNTFDYFVHKDLGGFLRRELDFYIKNEVLHLDDLDEAPEANWNETRAKLKALRTIAAKVIRFLAQLEDFQKKLWLKKKFVTACDYVVTLDRIPEELYPEIAACDAQREEWVRLFAIDEIKGDLGRAGYSVPLTVKFLRENQALLVKTGLLPTEVARQIVAVCTNFDGCAIKGENYQGLRFLSPAYTSRIKGVYIDPPYNTGGDDFVYKDNFQHSSWASLMSDRLRETRNLLSSQGGCACNVNDIEDWRLRGIIETGLGSNAYITTVVTKCSTASSFRTVNVGPVDVTDRILLFAKDRDKYSFTPQPVAKPVDLQHFSRFIINFDEPPSNWFFKPIKLQVLHDLGIDCETTQAGMKEARAKWGDAATAIITKAAETFALANAERVFETKTLQKPSPWLREHIRKSLAEPNAIISIDRDGAEPIILMGGRQFYFLGKGVIEVGGKRILTEPASTLWTDIDTNNLKHEGSVEFPAGKKPLKLVQRILEMGKAADGDTFLDFFAGSGTTGHAVINLNREDGGDRKYILIEMGEHFDTVLVPRLKKVIYSSDWKDGKPQSRNTGVSHCFKILRLESYEDTLNNLRLSRTRAQELALEAMTPEAREDYRLGYMLDLEAGGSQSLLNVSAFTDPWNYTMEIATGTAGETKTTKVDLVETFNWLLGLTVLAQGHGGGVQWVEGTNPEGDKVLVLWRNTTEVDADALNDWCKKQKISVLDGEFDLIYVNGDHHLENLRREDQTWKVRLTDEEFPKLMWEGCE